jgi:hypothetical protein
MSDLSSKYNAFSKVMSVYFKSKEIYGLIVYHDDEYTEVPVYDETVTVPILKIKNPNNIPFSYNALSSLLDDELDTVGNFANVSIKSYQRPSLIVLNDFNKGEFYIPKENEKKLYKILEISSNHIKIDKNLIDNKCFILGKEVEDFHILDEKTLYTINVSIIKKLRRKLKKLKKIMIEQELKFEKQEKIIKCLFNNTQ